jgi:hypothetical protein
MSDFKNFSYITHETSVQYRLSATQSYDSAFYATTLTYRAASVVNARRKQKPRPLPIGAGTIRACPDTLAVQATIMDTGSPSQPVHINVESSATKLSAETKVPTIHGIHSDVHDTQNVRRYVHVALEQRANIAAPKFRNEVA